MLFAIVPINSIPTVEFFSPPQGVRSSSIFIVQSPPSAKKKKKKIDQMALVGFCPCSWGPIIELEYKCFYRSEPKRGFESRSNCGIELG